MERQKDWFTGINYYDNYQENEIIVEEIKIERPIEVGMHEQVQMIYVKEGLGQVEINGVEYEISSGSFLCLYSHHFYSINNLNTSLIIVSVSFYIGLFMSMCWEKHPKNAHNQLVYDTCPVVLLEGEEKNVIERLFLDILKEKNEKRFEHENLVAYMALALHGYHCRYTFENIGMIKKENQKVWEIIKQVLLCTQEKLFIDEIAKQESCSPKALNCRIKKTCGYTFFQLQQYGKIINACALLHFPELSLEYISDLLGFSSIQSFYRVFGQYMGQTPREYQSEFVINEELIKTKFSLALRFLQFFHLYFMQDIQIEMLCNEFFLKEYTVKQIISENFGKDLQELLSEIRVSYACSFLTTTDNTILEIAIKCGFNSLSTFQRAFMRYMNQTPKDYRKYFKDSNNRVKNDK